MKKTLSTLVVLMLPAVASAASTTLTVSTPTNNVPKSVVVMITPPSGIPKTVAVPISPGMTALAKRNAIVASLNAAGVHADPAPSSNQLTVATPDGSTAQLIDNGTGELQDGVSSNHINHGTCYYPGHFEPLDYAHQPAIFTAGLVSDLGMVTVQVSASELNFQTDGPIICQALFQRLAPRAPQYGAQINYAGDRLEVYFDPAYTVTQGGIIFGTSSVTQGDSGSVVLPPSCPGDTNCDGILNGLDIGPFIEDLLDPLGAQNAHPYCDVMRADVDSDGTVSILDLAAIASHFLQNVSACP